jgi:nicotinate-nucleotide adenylyltransferase
MSEFMFDTDNIRATIKEMQGEKRFNHTLGVEEEAFELGKIFMPDKCEKLALCGLLHDITKKLKTDEQLALCDEYGIEVDRSNIAPKLLHSKTGCEFARRKFGNEIVDDEIYNGIKHHTTGSVDMTLLTLLFILRIILRKHVPLRIV